MSKPTCSKDITMPIGSQVKVTNSGRCYSTYTGMAKYMGLTRWSNQIHRRVDEGTIYTVIAKAMHESGHYGEILGLVDTNGDQFIVGMTGVELMVAPSRSLSSQVEALEARLEAVTQERDALAARLKDIRTIMEV